MSVFFNLRSNNYFQNLNIIVYIITLLLSFLIFSNVAHTQENFVSSIIVDGNKRISSETITSISKIKSGSTYTPSQLNSALQRIKKTTYFKSVDISLVNNVLMINVVENPTINSINFEKNIILKDEDLKILINSRDRQTLQPSKIQQDAELIANAYSTKGFILAQVTPKLIELSDNRVDIIFEIDEGKITEIEKISFKGNRSFSDIRLRGVISTKQASLFRNVIQSDTFIKDRFDYDEQLIENFYINRGFIDFKVISSSALLTREKSAFLLSFTIEEGQRYKFGNIKFNNPEKIEFKDELHKLINFKVGNYYDPRKIDKLINKIDIALSKQGINFVTLSPEFIRDNENLTVDIVMNFVPTKKIFVERIEIEGNATTLDEVIRLKFDFVEGDPFNKRKITEAADKIRSLGFFSDVNISTRNGSSNDKVIIVVKLKEKPTGSLGLGAGYNSSDGSVLTFNINERNFLGKGQTLDLAISTSSIEREMTLRFEDPSYLGRNLLAGISFGRKSSTPYSVPLIIDNSHIAPKLKFPLSRDSSLDIIYRLDQDRIKLSSAGVNISPLIQSDVGNKTKSGFIFSYNLDKTNSPFSPTSGYEFEAKQEINGLGGDIKYTKTLLSAKRFNSLVNEKVIISSDISSGIIGGSDANIINRFKLGGDDLRGFRNYGIGPVDNQYTNSDQNGDPLGGKMFAVVNIQASFPIGIPEEYGVFGGLFIGAGSVWGLDKTLSETNNIDDSAKVRSAAGVSIFWDTLIGPLRFNFSRPIMKEKYDITENFRFTVDTRF